MGSGASETRTMGTRRRWRGLLAALVGLGLALLAASSPALALSQRGQVFSFAFAEEGSKNGQLSSPGGVAVNESTHDVYVVDRGNQRVEEFDSTGAFVRQFAAKRAQNIAIDNSKVAGDESAGDLYVTEGKKLEKFDPSGKSLGKVATKTSETLWGVAVDSAGTVFLSFGTNEVAVLSDAEPNKLVGEEPISAETEPLRPGLAVDSSDNLYADYESEEAFKEEGKELPCEHDACVAGKVTTREITHGGTQKSLAPGEFLNSGVDLENTSDVAVNSSDDDVYLDNVTSVAEFDPTGTLVQRFGEGHLAKGSGLAIDASTGDVYVADEATGMVQVFVPEPARKPQIDALSVAKVKATAAGLVAQIDPGGAATSATFEYGASSCASAACSTSSAISLGEAFGDQTASFEATGLAANTTYHYRVTATNSFGTVTSEEGTFDTPTEGSTLALPDSRSWELVSPAEKNGSVFESISREGGLIQSSPDGSALTFISTSPPEGGPEGNRSPTFTQNLAHRESSGTPAWSSKDIAIRNGIGQGVSPGKEQEYDFFSSDLSQSLVAPYGFTTQAEPKLNPEDTEKTIYVRNDEHCEPAPSSCYLPVVNAVNDTAGSKFGGNGADLHSGVIFESASPDLNHVVVSSSVPLTSEEAAPESHNLYEWSAATRELKLVNLLPASEVTSESGPAAKSPVLGQAGMARNAISEDGSRVIWSAGKHLYMRDMTSGVTIRVDTPEAGAEVGPFETAKFQTASTDGSKIFFTDEQRLTVGSTASSENNKNDLYVYDVNTAKLTDLSVNSANAAEAADVQGLLPGASEKGDNVYFVANGALGSAANSRGETAKAGHCVEGGAVPAPGATCNLYAEHFNGTTWEAPALVAVLSVADRPDWEQTTLRLLTVTSRVSPDGNFLAFMSDRSLTGYDNRDTSAAAANAPDEEVFRYERESGSVVCASCNPTGARPTGVFDIEQAGEGLGLLVDRVSTWEERWLSGSIPGWTGYEGDSALYQSRYLSDTGRLFFNSTDALVPQDENSKEDVYEYESSGEGSCAKAEGCVALISSGTSDHESAFLDASTSGDDVFFLTSAKLVAADTDTNFDVYDARVCSSGSPCIAYPSSTTTGSCASASECKAAPPSAPSVGSGATESGATTGNIAGAGAVLNSKTVVKPTPKPLTRAQKLAKALKSCKKLKKKNKRVACEKTARKRYGAKKASKKKAKKGAKR